MFKSLLDALGIRNIGKMDSGDAMLLTVYSVATAIATGMLTAPVFLPDYSGGWDLGATYAIGGFFTLSLIGIVGVGAVAYAWFSNQTNRRKATRERLEPLELGFAGLSVFILVGSETLPFVSDVVHANVSMQVVSFVAGTIGYIILAFK